jgi:hypothetical protein
MPKAPEYSGNFVAECALSHPENGRTGPVNPKFTVEIYG